ncbi:hypothetical protein E3N88_04225 [Mikania micrantha]|uniref:Uncharacterized protein n=1 Tax=Mikania micrantha TaxID=192012 RepID=A0A5N6PV30_9ASTR|nr:hypothetical protein E3N88_04225 [Mikania micrantha]
MNAEMNGGGLVAENGRKRVSRNNDNEKVDYVYKVVVIGDSAVGKTQVLSRFARNEFCFDSKSTIGVEFQTRTLRVWSKVIKAQIWGTAGQESLPFIAQEDYNSMLPFSFGHQRWVEELRAHADNSIVIALIGNKADLEEKRAVPSEDAMEFAEDQNLYFFETSALTGDNVEAAFNKLLEEIYSVVSKKTLDHDLVKTN